MKIAVIPARGGSVRIPRKNIKSFIDRPIIAYSIRTAKESGLFEHIYCSTEDAEIAEIARYFGAKHLPRPLEFADDSTGTQEVMRYHANQAPCRSLTHPAHHLCCIYPCAPLMRPEHLVLGFQQLKKYGADFAFPVGTNPLCDAGQWYWGKFDAFAEGRPLFGPDSLMIPLPPEFVCDINTMQDWYIAERMYEALHRQEQAA